MKHLLKSGGSLKCFYQKKWVNNLTVLLMFLKRMRQKVKYLYRFLQWIQLLMTLLWLKYEEFKQWYGEK
jgi:hypothetical protein